MFASVKRQLYNGAPASETSGQADYPTVYGELMIRRGIAVLYHPLNLDRPLMRLLRVEVDMRLGYFDLSGLELTGRKVEYQVWRCRVEDPAKFKEPPPVPRGLRSVHRPGMRHRNP